MVDILHACRDGELYTAVVSDMSDITDLVGGRHLEALSSTALSIVFWFNPHLHLVSRGVNPLATELLLATTSFTARTVPLLRGDVVVTSHDSDGNLAGLTPRCVDRLIHSHPSFWEERILGRRLARDRHQQRQGISIARAV